MDEAGALMGSRDPLLKIVVGQKRGFGLAGHNSRLEHDGAISLFPQQEFCLRGSKSQPTMSVSPNGTGLTDHDHVSQSTS